MRRSMVRDSKDKDLLVDVVTLSGIGFARSLKDVELLEVSQTGQGFLGHWRRNRLVGTPRKLRTCEESAATCRYRWGVLSAACKPWIEAPSWSWCCR